MFEQVEELVRTCVERLRLLAETLAALVIAAGVLLVLMALVRHLLSRQRDGFLEIRLLFVRYLTLAF